MTGRALIAWLGALGLLLGTGCGKPVLRIADPSLGDYYTDEEFRRLREDQRDEYCAELAEQDSSYVAAMAELRAALDEIDARRVLAAAGADSLARLADSLEARAGGTRVAARGRAEGRHVVVEGESLWRIAAGEATYGDGREWTRLYEANRDAIRDPDLIYPGQEIRIPR